MDIRLFLSVFSAIFIAELADKTQLVGICMTSKTGKPLAVWVASVSAYMVVTAISVLIGYGLSKYLKPEIVRYCGASVFIIIGFLMMFNKI